MSGFREDFFLNIFSHHKQRPLVVMFLMDQLILAIFIEGYLVTISAKLFSISDNWVTEEKTL